MSFALLIQAPSTAFSGGVGELLARSGAVAKVVLLILLIFSLLFYLFSPR